MKTREPKLKLFHAQLCCAVALGISASFNQSAAADPSAIARSATAADSTNAPAAKTFIPFSQLGARAGADYRGDGLAVTPAAEGARLRCAFQRLEGEATPKGLWLTSTTTNTANDRFR